MKNISGLLNTMVDDVIFTQNILNYPFSHVDRSDNKIKQIKRVLPSDFLAGSSLQLEPYIYMVDFDINCIGCYCQNKFMGSGCKL